MANKYSVYDHALTGRSNCDRVIEKFKLALNDPYPATSGQIEAYIIASQERNIWARVVYMCENNTPKDDIIAVLQQDLTMLVKYLPCSTSPVHNLIEDYKRVKLYEIVAIIEELTSVT